MTKSVLWPRPSTTWSRTSKKWPAFPCLSPKATSPSKWSRAPSATRSRSEEHTSELQSLTNLVCRLLLENKNRIATDSSHALRCADACVHGTLAFVGYTLVRAHVE